MNKKLGKRIGAIVLSLAIVIGIIFSAALEVFAYTPTTGTVTSDNVKVRESASTTAKQVSSLKNGDVIDIVDEATDASGYVWYKIRVNKSEYGYVRSDLIKKEGGSSSTSTTTTTSTETTESTTKTTESNSSAASLPETSVVSVDQKSATITTESANVRKGAGTGYDVVGKVTKGTTVTITGEATGTDSKTWYQITFGDGKTGFLRSDLLEISDAPVETEEGGEGEVPEATEGTEGENPEGENQEAGNNSGSGVASEVGDGTYSLVYLTDEEGNGVWYLYDNVQSTRVKVNELVEVANSASKATAAIERNKKYRVIIVVLCILVAILVGGVVFLALKLREGLYYEDDEEDEYDRYSENRRGGMRERVPSRYDREEEDDEPKPQRPRRNPEDDRDSREAREPRSARPARPRREDEYENRSARRERDEADVPSRRSRSEDADRPVRRDRDEAERPSRRPDDSDRDRRDSRSDAYDRPRTSPKRRAKNFIGDEDDFEFEFLDLDDDK